MKTPNEIAEEIISQFPIFAIYTVEGKYCSEAIAAAIHAERDKADKLEHELEMYIDKVSDLGMEAQREVIRHIATRERERVLREALKPFVDACLTSNERYDRLYSSWFKQMPADWSTEISVTMGQLRSADAALAGKGL